jgi:hypothetical protein
VPHIYLSLDVRLDALLKLRGELNASLAGRGVKLSVNDILIKALGVALEQVPVCNVAFAGDTIRQYNRADVSVAVSIPNGLITRSSRMPRARVWPRSAPKCPIWPSAPRRASWPRPSMSAALPACRTWV